MKRSSPSSPLLHRQREEIRVGHRESGARQPRRRLEMHRTPGNAERHRHAEVRYARSVCGRARDQLHRVGKVEHVPEARGEGERARGQQPSRGDGRSAAQGIVHGLAGRGAERPRELQAVAAGRTQRVQLEVVQVPAAEGHSGAAIEFEAHHDCGASVGERRDVEILQRPILVPMRRELARIFPNRDAVDQDARFVHGTRANGEPALETQVHSGSPAAVDRR